MESKNSTINDCLIGRRETSRRMGYKSIQSVIRLERRGKLRRVPFPGQCKYFLSNVLALIQEGGVS